MTWLTKMHKTAMEKHEKKMELSVKYDLGGGKGMSNTKKSALGPAGPENIRVRGKQSVGPERAG